MGYEVDAPGVVPPLAVVVAGFALIATGADVVSWINLTAVL
jgi:hypothetical protein